MFRMAILVVAASTCGLSFSAAPDAPSVTAIDLKPDAAQPAGVVPWARPLEGGAIKVAAIVPVFGQADLAGLIVRLALDVDVVPVWGCTSLGAPGNAVSPTAAAFDTASVEKRLLELVSDNRAVILIGNIAPHVLPESVQKAVAEQVQGGAGLLVIRYGAQEMSFVDTLLGGDATPVPSESIMRGSGLDALPPRDRDRIGVQAAEVGKGRVCVVSYSGDPAECQSLLPAPAPLLSAEVPYTETYFSIAAKAVVWAAQRTPEHWIDAIQKGGPPEPAEEDIPPNMTREAVEEMLMSQPRLPTQPIRLVLNKAPGRGYAVRLGSRLPLRDLRQVYEPERWPGGEATLDAFLAVGPEKLDADAWLLKRDKVVDWFTRELDFAGLPQVTGLRLSGDRLYPHGAVGVTLDIKPRPGQELPSTAAVRAVDGLGRQVAETVQPVDGTATSATLTVNFYDLISSTLRLDAYLVDSPRESISLWDIVQSSYAKAELPVRTPWRDQGLAFWAEGLASEEYAVAQYHRALAALGVNGLVLAPAGAGLRGVADAGLSPIVCLNDASLGLSAGAVADPEAEAAQVAALTRTAAVYGPAIVLFDAAAAYAPDYAALTATRSMREAFQRYLRSAYASLAALNDSWGANFPTWEEVSPPAIEASGVSGASFAPWLDTDRFRADYVESTADAYRAAVRSVDAESHAGLMFAKTGFDWARAAARLDAFILPPDVLAIEKMRSYRRPETVATVCLTGEGVPLGEEARWLTWYATVRGLNGVFVGHPYGTVDASHPATALSPDARPPPDTAALSALVAELRGGLGELYRKATPVAPSVAVYDSPASAVLNVVNPAFGEVPEGAARAWVNLLNDTHVGFAMVSSDDVARGALKPFKVLVLPMARALSDGECDAIRAFVGDGGLVIADVLPGQFDAHGVLRDASPLAGLFGVAQNKAPLPVKVPSVDIAVTLGERTESGTLRNVVEDAALTATDAVAQGQAGDVPLWLHASRGAGTTLLFNHATPEYGAGEDSDDGKWLRQVVARLLSQASVPLVVPEGIEVDGDAHVLATHHRFGAADLVAVLRTPHGGAKRARTVLHFDKDGDLYDVRQGMPVARQRKVVLRLEKGEAAVYARLPYRVEAVRLDMPKQAVLGKRIPINVSVEVSEGLPGDHLVHVSVSRIGEVEPIAHYSQTLFCSQGAGQGFIPLALNDPRGFVRVTARDVLSGVTATADVELQAP